MNMNNIIIKSNKNKNTFTKYWILSINCRYACFELNMMIKEASTREI